MPLLELVGAGAPLGRAIYSQVVVSPFSVQPNVSEVVVILDVVNRVGGGHTSAGPQLISATQPGLFTVESLLKRKVRLPSLLVEVKGPGIVVPQNPPARPPGTEAAGFVLAI